MNLKSFRHKYSREQTGLYKQKQGYHDQSPAVFAIKIIFPNAALKEDILLNQRFTLILPCLLPLWYYARKTVNGPLQNVEAWSTNSMVL